MDFLQIRESDLEESFTRSGGKGGQNVNKVSTAVHIKHKPTGIEVKCSLYRTQGLNRYKARAILCEKVEERNSKTSGIISESDRKLIRNKRKDAKRKKEKYSRKGKGPVPVSSIDEENFLESDFHSAETNQSDVEEAESQKAGFAGEETEKTSRTSEKTSGYDSLDQNLN